MSDKTLNRLYICSLLLLNAFLAYLVQDILNIRSLLANSLSEQLTATQVENLLNAQQKWQWVGYGFIPFLLLIKMSITALVLSIACMLTDRQVPYKRLFVIVAEAEIIFLLVPVCKIIWFYFFQPQHTLEDIQFFYPLSLLNLTDYKQVAQWYVYPLQLANLFEVGYWLLLTYLLGKVLKISFKERFYFVASSYGVLLLLWVVVVMFFTLNYS
ncbi:hypothetical protein [Capnocytophaga catalasegens]|uniref:Yip1 domain-containing protein n=1 Tax=Capnocytophaga catalasegens TaxID=1004260 RepID=A0AAV5ARB5_9FLAO|nr:hypothetical protein [Capnocytophaga catalasegens]GIZ14086.1 hypothetical protein RCZ03_00870 [Capnocytophaga catalasegens]GJM49084.1 hypothetical protein RCZ15_00600 [Capnocytophaga catalasegens]GJM52345.1 hypothetical protein RCZ16_06630 [Capnocytophaga catalasegens]